MQHDRLTDTKVSCSPVDTPLTSSAPVTSTNYRRQRTFAWLTGLLLIAFALPLVRLARFAVASQLFSYVLLVPFISGYLVWIKRSSLPTALNPVRHRALIPLAAGVILMLGYWLTLHSGALLVKEDYLAWNISALFLFFIALCFFTLGADTLRAVAFPLAFLVFIVPFPASAVDFTETFLQHASALAAHILFTLLGTPFLRNGTSFQLPGVRIEVAPECSGIHSTLVLFITSLIAGYLFLRTPWRRSVLALAVIPLGILRNAVRIVIISELCVHISPDMIDSPIHRRGGPLFFMVALVPLFLLLVYLRKSEIKTQPSRDISKPRS